MQIKIKNYSGRKPEITGIDILNGDDFFLQVGDKEYRFYTNRNGDLVMVLINGHDVGITTYNSYPAVVLKKK
jgi:hypothetical protein